MSKIQFNIGIFFLLFLQLIFIDNYHNWGDDFALYLHQAKALFIGDLHTLHVDNTLMMNKGKIGPYLYPNGFPLLLSITYFLNVTFWSFKLIGVISFIVGIIFLNKIYSLYINPKIARLLSLFVAIQPFLFFHTNNILSDLPALSTSLIATYLFLSINWEKRINISMFLFSIFILFTVTIRGNYLFLTAGFLGVALFRYVKKSNNTIKQIVFALIPFIVYIILSKSFLISDGSNEIQSLSETLINKALLIATFTTNISYYTEIFSFNMVHGKYSLTIFALFLFFILIGVSKRIKNTISNLSDYKLSLFILNASFVSIYLIWPYLQGPRFVFYNLVFMPLFVYLITTKYTSKIIYQSFFSAFLTFSLLTFSNQYIHSLLKSYTANRKVGSLAFEQAMSYVNKNSSPEAIILCNKPRVIHYFADRRSVMLYPTNFNQLQKGGLIAVRLPEDSADFGEIFPNPESVLIPTFRNNVFAIYKKK